MRKEAYTCDVCGAEKNGTGPAWMMGKVITGDLPRVIYRAWENGPIEGYGHFCSAACAAKHLTQWIEAKTW